MAPDFVYFLPLGADGGFTHSAAGVLLYCVPAGLLAWLVYHLLLRDAFLAWAPAGIAARMAPRADWQPHDVRSAAIVLASLALGAATHVCWDALTHVNTALVRQFDLLRMPIDLGSHAVPLFKLLQHLSSLFGAIVIAIWYLRRKPGPLPPARLEAGQRLAVFAAICAAAAAGGAAGFWLRPARSVERGLFNTIVTAMAAAAAMILLLSAARRWSTRGA